jgi:hypothetical protein
MNLRSRGAHPQKAITTINRASLGRSERHRSLNRAQSASDRHLNSFARKRLPESVHVGGDAFVLLALAWLTAFGIVPQTLVRKEELLARGESELLAAVDTSQHAIRVLVHCWPPMMLRGNQPYGTDYDDNAYVNLWQ